MRNAVHCSPKRKQELSTKYANGIVCWGDSLTAGFGGGGVSYPGVLQQCLQEAGLNIPVVNMGVNGEDTWTILGRSGADPYIIFREARIPADPQPVPIELCGAGGGPVVPLVYGDRGMDRVWIVPKTSTDQRDGGAGEAGDGGIAEIEGRLVLHTDRNYEDHYYFIRSAAGEPVRIRAGSRLDTQAHRAYRTFSPIVYMGENGFYTDPEDLIRQYRILLRAYDSAEGRFLVIGAHTGSAAERFEMEKAMQAAFGNRYINLRKYMAERGLEDAGMAPGLMDLRMMEKGYTPESLLSDQAHFNSIGYELFGKLVAERL